MLLRNRGRVSLHLTLAVTVLSACGTDGQVAPNEGTHAPAQLALVWHNSGSSMGSPQVAGNTAYYRTTKHEIVAFSKATGTHRWTTPLPVSDQYYYGEDMEMVGNTLVAGDIYLFGIDSTNGKIKWKAQPSRGFNPGLFRFTTDGVHVFTGSSSGHVFSFDGNTGQEIWSVALVPNLATSIFTVDLAEQTLYAGFTVFYTGGTTVRPDSGGVAAIDANTGSLQWLTYLPRTTTNLPTKIVGSVVWGPYVITSSREGYIYALKRSDGSIAWTAPPLSPGDYDSRPVAVSNSTVFAGSDFGIVAAYNASSGQKLWQTNLNHGSVDYHISADPKFVYAIDGAGDLNILSVTDGKLILRQQPPSSKDIFNYEPLVQDSVIYIGGNTGFFAFKRP